MIASSKITVTTIRQMLREVVEGGADISVIRDRIFAFYEGEENISVEGESVERLVAVLACYLEFQEAFGDGKVEVRMTRLLGALDAGYEEAEHAVFALEFHELMRLTTMLDSGAIDRDVFKAQTEKLSPIDLDWDRIRRWCLAQEDRGELELSKLS